MLKQIALERNRKGYLRNTRIKLNYQLVKIIIYAKINALSIGQRYISGKPGSIVRVLRDPFLDTLKGKSRFENETVLFKR